MKPSLAPCHVLIVALACAGCQTAPRGTVISPAQANQAQKIDRGHVERVREIVIDGRATAIGRNAGWVGAAAGTGIGSGLTGRSLAIAGGFVVAQILGEALEKQARRQPGQEIFVQLENGTSLAVTQPGAGGFGVGDAVLIVHNADGARVVAR